MESLRGKVFMLVGAASVEGQAVAKAFAKYSAKVSLCGTSEDELTLNELAKECSKLGSEVITTILSDMNNNTEVERSVKETVERYGHLHGLIHLVSYEVHKMFEETTLEDLNFLHASHVESPLLWVQTTLPHLKASKGSVVLLSSGQPQNPVLGMFPFALTKAAEDHLVRTMALDLAGYGIRVNAVCPMYQTIKFGETKMEYQSIKSSVAEYVTYLSTDMANFITGQCITIGSDFTSGGAALVLP